MRHHNSNRKFGLKRGPRTALLKALATSLIMKERITTTEAKAKEIRPYVEKLVTKGKVQTVTSRRLIATKVGTEATKKVVDIISPKYKARNGGYTRIMRLPRRISDGSAMAMIEFV